MERGRQNAEIIPRNTDIICSTRGALEIRSSAEGVSSASRSMRGETQMMKIRAISAALAIAFAGFAASASHADPIPTGWQASNMTAVGYTGLDDHVSPFKLSIKQANGRWYLYTAHSGRAGLSIVDVTDPTQPKYLKYIPGPEGTSGPQVTLHDNL